jgi:hypothetical protein
MAIELSKIAAMKSRFVTREVGNELVIVPLTGNVAKMNALFTLNETGKFIWESISEVQNMDQLAACMVDEFDIDMDTARNDVEVFLTRLEQTLVG